MLDVIELAVFHLAVFGGAIAASDAIASALDRVGIWPVEEKETTQKPCSEIAVARFNSGR